MRLFFAIELPEQAKVHMSQLQSKLKASLGEAHYRWTKPDRMHVTLAFLGNVPESRLKQLGSIASEVAAGFRPTEAILARIDAFPSASKPRILWTGVQQSSEVRNTEEDLALLAEELGKRCSGLADRPSGGGPKLHVTLARAAPAARLLGSRFKTCQDAMNHSYGSVAVTDFVLFSSEAGETGPHYHLLQRFRL